MAKRLKLIFRVEDVDSKEVVIGDQQTILTFSDEARAESAHEAEKFAKQLETEKSVDPRAVDLIRDLWVREMTDAAGSIVSRFCAPVILKFLAQGPKELGAFSATEETA